MLHMNEPWNIKLREKSQTEGTRMLPLHEISRYKQIYLERKNEWLPQAGK